MANRNSNEQLFDDDIIDLRQYFRVLNRYKWGIIGLAIAMSVLVGLVTFSMTPIYSAQSTLLIESSDADVVSIEEVYGLESASDEYFQTQFEILKSRSLIAATIEKANLLDNKTFSPDGDGFNWKTIFPFSLIFAETEGKVSEEVILQQAINRFSDAMTISPIRNTQLVQINFESPDSKLAANVANIHANQYIESIMESKLDATMRASEWLSERLTGLRDDVRAAEQRVQEFREREGIAGSAGGMTLANMELERVSENIVEAREKRLELESLFQQVKGVDVSDPDQIDLIPSVLQSNLIRDIKSSLLDIQRRKAELSKRYGYRHPRMISVNNELDSALTTYKAQVQSILNGVENEYRVALSSEKSLEKSMEQVRSSFQSSNRKEYEFRELEQEATTRREIYNTFLTRFNETSATGDLTSANARISDPAVAPIHPAKPRKKLIVAITFVLSLMGGVVLAFLSEALNNTVKTPDDVELKLHSNMLGLVPIVDIKSEGVGDVYSHFLTKNKSNYAESVRTIRTGLILSSLDEEQKIISVTSTVPGEGKTSTSMSLAFAFGQMEKVLLIDADMRRPSIGKAVGINQTNRPGLSNVIAGTATLSEALYDYVDGKIKVLSSGPVPPNPLELMGSKRFKALLAELRTHFDRIIIDTAPSGAVSDALALSKLSDTMVYVVKADATPANQVANSLNRLKEVDADISGVVLNQLNMSKNAAYYEQYYSGYYNYHNYGTES